MKMVNTRAPSTTTAMPARTRMTIRLGLPSVGGIHPWVGSGSGGGTQPVAGCAGSGAGVTGAAGSVGSGCGGRIARLFVHDPSCASAGGVCLPA